MPPVHIPSVIGLVILNRGYVPVYLSPELNPIEQLWAIHKGKVKRNKLKDVEALTVRIIEGIEAVHVGHLQIIIQDSVNLFDNCRNKAAI